MKNGPGQARGQRSPVLLAPESGQERNTLFHVMTGLLGPGPRGMAVCHAVARPTHDYKNPLPLSQVRAGGLVSPVSGEGGTFGRRAGAPPSPRPHPPPNALFSGRWAGAVARQATRVSRVPRCGGRVGAAGKKMRARPGGFPCRGQKTWGEGAKERTSVVRRHAASGMRTGVGGRGRNRQAPCGQSLKGKRDEGKGRFAAGAVPLRRGAPWASSGGPFSLMSERYV